MGSATSILDYRSTAEPPQTRDVRRFHVIYFVGIAVAYITVWVCVSAWPHTSNSADSRKDELAMTIQVAGGAACAWLALAIRRILGNNAIRRSVWTWFLVTANVFVGLAVLPAGY